jgi:tRNA1(Val) A37 N6-methylase TrmN6
VKLTQGHLLGGRIAYAQPASGHRSGIEPVLLAAAVPARAGARVLEAGTGAGAALLCLAARVPGLDGLGVDIDPALVALATRNAAANGFRALAFIVADIRAGVALPGAPFDHALANPPYHDPAATASPDPGRAQARQGQAGDLARWIAGLARALRPGGTVSLVVPARAVPDCIAGLAGAGCGSAELFPLWPRAGMAAKLVILRAKKAGRGAFRLHSGLVLHDAAGFTPAAEAVLRQGAALEV